MKDSVFYKQANLLLRVLPIINEHRVFALKGGTAINFFVRDLPRLSVDIDLTYLKIEKPCNLLNYKAFSVIFRSGARRARTADLLTASQTLSQLSYSPKQKSKLKSQKSKFKNKKFKIK